MPAVLERSPRRKELIPVLLALPVVALTLLLLAGGGAALVRPLELRAGRGVLLVFWVTAAPNDYGLSVGAVAGGGPVLTGVTRHYDAMGTGGLLTVGGLGRKLVFMAFPGQRAAR